MTDLPTAGSQVLCVSNFVDLISTPFVGAVNALCWQRELAGDFAEIVHKIAADGNITVVEPHMLLALELSEQGQLARRILLADLEALSAHGASPVLNVISHYERDDAAFPTDVYSFHADRSPIATDTFLCTYHGAPSDILPNAQARQKVLVPEILAGLEAQYDGKPEAFDAWLGEHCFDLHYEPLPGAQPISLGLGQLWRLAVAHPGSRVPPCIHRAPLEKDGKKRLLLIC